MESLRHIRSSEATVAHAEWHFFPAGPWTAISSTFFFEGSPYRSVSLEKKVVRRHSPKEFSEQDIMETAVHALIYRVSERKHEVTEFPFFK